MIDFSRFQLDNGLKVIVHEDTSTPLAVVNILYNVGARDESPDKTGFAHLFEHLMFEGSVNVPVFDEPIERVGGSTNAFTSNDVTNYYDIIPANNLETAFWLESDRMMSLNFEQERLDVQIKVVSEEFKEHYLNQPYGDVWHKMMAMAYKQHPYQWPTIGKNLEHIEQSKIEDVKDFFFKYYRPNNAIMVVAGNVKHKEVEELAKKWFGEMEPLELPKRNYTPEPKQVEERKTTIFSKVPLNAIYKAYHMGGRMDKDYYVMEVLSDLLSGGKSSRLYRALVKERQVFSEVEAYVTGSFDPGLFFLEGKLIKGIEIEEAEKALNEEIEKLKNELVPDNELEKIKNQAEAHLMFEETNLFTKAFHLAYYDIMGDAKMINEEGEKYQKVTKEDIQASAKETFVPENCSTIYYNSIS